MSPVMHDTVYGGEDGTLSTRTNTESLDILIKAIEVLKVEEGDVIILECKSDISVQQYNDMAKVFEDLLENIGLKNVSVAILSSGMRIKAIRPAGERLRRRMDGEFQKDG